jgi:alpha-L-rhamnosidase
MFGGGLVWYYRKLAGMNTDTEAPGYKHIIFKPQPAGDVTFAKYYNQTSYGEAGIFWEMKNGQFSMKVTVPVGCRATVYVPLLKGKTITENGQKVTDSINIKILNRVEGYQLFSLNSGMYFFVSK